MYICSYITMIAMTATSAATPNPEQCHLSASPTGATPGSSAPSATAAMLIIDRQHYKLPFTAMWCMRSDTAAAYGSTVSCAGPLHDMHATGCDMSCCCSTTTVHRDCYTVHMQTPHWHSSQTHCIQESHLAWVPVQHGTITALHDGTQVHAVATATV